MRNSTIIALGTILFAALPTKAELSSPFRLLDQVKSGKCTAARQHAPKATQEALDSRMKLSEIASKLKPTVTKTYGWTGKKWLLDESITYTYDTSGNPIAELSVDNEGDYVSTVCEYDANGMVTFKESKVSRDGVNYDNYKKTEFEYDDILTNVITKRTEWLWMDYGKGYDWQLVGNNYKRIITRNDEGNITSVVIAVLFEGVYDPTIRVDITYGEDSKATTISEQILGYDGSDYYWEQGLKITDIEWENTDGQIYDPENLFIGNNRIKSANYVDEDDMNFDVSAEYFVDSEAYNLTMKGVLEDDEMGGIEIVGTAEYTSLENDGYIMETSTSYMGFEAYTSKEEVRYDDWGHMTLSYMEEEEDDEVYYEKTIGTVEYDEEGRPISYTVSEEYLNSFGKPVTENAFRAEYFDYIDVTASVEDLNTDVDSPVRYYNLQGMRVKHPESGAIVIKQIGNKTSKIKY